MKEQIQKSAQRLVMAGILMTPGAVGVPVVSESFPQPLVRNAAAAEIKLAQAETENQLLTEKHLEHVNNSLNTYVNIESEPEFFNTMKQRLVENSGEYYKFFDEGDNSLVTYHPDGIDTSDRMAFILTYEPLTDTTGNPNYKRISNQVYLSLGTEATLNSPLSIMRNFTQDEILGSIYNYLNIPPGVEQNGWLPNENEVMGEAAEWDDQGLFEVPYLENKIGGNSQGIIRLEVKQISEIVQPSPTTPNAVV